MNLYKVKYEERKNSILELLEKSKSFCYSYGKSHQGEVFNNLIESLRNEEFSIVLVGEFSAGKSTFLNALMGKKILPSFTDETTATVNFLRHKEKSENGEEGKVYLNDGSVTVLDEVNFDVINKYVCTKSDIGVANSVKHLDLYLNSKFLEGNVTLVDSPGLNGTADGHREITEAQIEKSSASIFMFKADQPGSKTDFEFLRGLKSRVNTIIFVLNKIDDIKVSEGETPESVIQSLKNNYKKQFPEESTIPEIWGVSAYQALVARSELSLDYRDRNDYSDEEKSKLEDKSRMREFEDRLWKFLTQGEKAKSILLSPVEKVVSIFKELMDNAKIEIETLSCKEDTGEIEDKIIEIKNQIESINDTISNSTREIKGKINRLLDEIIESFEAKVESLKNIQVKRLENWDDIDELIEFEKSIIEKSDKEFSKIIKTCEKEFINGINEIIEENYEQVVDEVNDNLRDSEFNIEINSKYEPTETDIKLGIEKYENEIKALEQMLEAKRDEIDSNELQGIKLRKAERERERLQEKIEETKSSRQVYEYSSSGPSRSYSTVKDKEAVDRGILGKPIDFLFGKKYKSVDRTVVINEDEIREFKKVKESRVKEYSEEIESLKNKLNFIEVNDVSREEAELISKKIKSEERKLQIKIEEMQKEYRDNYIKKNKVALMNRKVEIESYFEEVSEEYLSEINKELKNKKTIFAEMIKNAISNDLNIKLENKNKEYLSLENKLKASQDEKEKYINELTNTIEDVNKIIEKAVYLQIDIESEEVNTIKEEVI